MRWEKTAGHAMALVVVACTGAGGESGTSAPGSAASTQAPPAAISSTTTADQETSSTAQATDSLVPVARGHLAMASIDEEIGVMLFGGVTAPPPDWEVLTDAWTMASGGWQRLDGIASVGGDTIAYDSGSGLVILYTAWEGPSEIWALAPSTGVWSQMSTDTVPQGLWAPHHVYDSESDVTILVGPPDPAPQPEIATWAYDVDTDTWTEMRSADAMPKRWFPAMTYDSASDRVIVFGGFSASDEPLGDTWVYDYDSDTWTEMTPDSSPPARGYSAMAHDPVSNRAVLFGGSTHPDPLNDTWVYDYEANNWTELEVEVKPLAREKHGMALNPVNGTIVMFGGAVPAGAWPDWEALPADTWIFHPAAETWTQVP